jgi:hypothetical protein
MQTRLIHPYNTSYPYLINKTNSILQQKNIHQVVL